MNLSNLKDAALHVCHRRPDRSFFYKGKQFPVCARCTGTAIGFLSLPLFALKLLTFGWWSFLLMLLPAYIDGSSQAMGWRESNNWLRLFTGILLGVAQMSLVAFCGDYVLEKTGLLQFIR